MTRDAIDYSAQTVRPVHVDGAVDVSTPVAGYYRFRLHSSGVRGGVQIWHGPPLDPVTGEALDRSWRWQARFNGEPIDFDRVWPACTAEPISKRDYLHYCERTEWARQNAPDSAYADSRRRHDPLSTQSPMMF